MIPWQIWKRVESECSLDPSKDACSHCLLPCNIYLTNLKNFFKDFFKIWLLICFLLLPPSLQHYYSKNLEEVNQWIAANFLLHLYSKWQLLKQNFGPNIFWFALRNIFNLLLCDLNLLFVSTCFLASSEAFQEAQHVFSNPLMALPQIVMRFWRTLDTIFKERTSW